MKSRPGALAIAALPLAFLFAAPGFGGDPAEPPAVSAARPAEDAVPLGPSLDERLDEIRRRVQAALSYPPIARARDEIGESLVEFEISSNGNPREIRTTRSSGSAALDRAAERAVRDAAPLPRVAGRVAVPVRFSLDD